MTYALFQVPAGYLVDRWDLRWSYAAAVAWWSLAAMAIAVVPSLGWLIVCRALLGVGESFNWPCALRVTARVLPPRGPQPRQRHLQFGRGGGRGRDADRGVATQSLPGMVRDVLGDRRAGIRLGGGLAAPGPPRAERLARQAQDRAGRACAPASGRGRLSLTARTALWCLAIASVGLAVSALRYGPAAVWLAIALLIMGPLAVAAILPAHHLAGAGWATILAEVVRLKRFWIMVVVSISINVCWHFLVNWIPAYLKTERHLAGSLGNYLSAITFLAADLGNLGGGWLSRRLATRTGNVLQARKLVMSLCVVLILSGPAMSLPLSDVSAMILLSLMAAGTAAFFANFFAFTQDVSARHTGFVVGYLGAVGNLFVAGYQPIAGSLRDMTGSFTANFLIVGLAPLVGIAALLWGWSEETPQDSLEETPQDSQQLAAGGGTKH